MNALDFKGRHAVITGGATGLGYGIAQRLLASGGSVTLWDRNGDAASKAAAALGAGAHAVAVDVTREESVAKALAATLAQSPRWACRRRDTQRRACEKSSRARGPLPA